MTRKQLFWTVVMVINIVTFAMSPNPASVLGWFIACWQIVEGGNPTPRHG